MPAIYGCSLMRNLDDGPAAGRAMSAVLLSPLLVIFALPVALGIGCDIIGAAGETPVALAISVSAAAAMLCGARLGVGPRRAPAMPRSLGDAD